jgi:hypothetical protein
MFNRRSMVWKYGGAVLLVVSAGYDLVMQCLHSLVMATCLHLVDVTLGLEDVSCSMRGVPIRSSVL